MDWHKKGSKEYFDIDWNNNKNTQHGYFSTQRPISQLQLAFTNHFELFSRLVSLKQGKSLETGCGRGNLSLYFANAGWETWLCDINKSAIDAAEENFSSLGFKGFFKECDAESLPFDDNSFDLTFSIGLLEHFERPEKALMESMRILKPGGMMMAYIVPERTLNVQTLFKPLNMALSIFKKIAAGSGQNFKNDKKLLYRNSFNSAYYLDILKKNGVKEMGSFGTFPIPLISYSSIYPFTPLPARAEKCITEFYRLYLRVPSLFTKEPWICSEWWGQAFVVWAKK